MLRHFLVFFSGNLHHFLHYLGVFVAHIGDDSIERFYLILELLALSMVLLVDSLNILLILTVVGFDEGFNLVLHIKDFLLEKCVFLKARLLLSVNSFV